MHIKILAIIGIIFVICIAIGSDLRTDGSDSIADDNLTNSTDNRFQIKSPFSDNSIKVRTIEEIFGN
jgi:hypothetical protein